jgi:hypothetical protein
MTISYLKKNSISLMEWFVTFKNIKKQGKVTKFNRLRCFFNDKFNLQIFDDAKSVRKC